MSLTLEEVRRVRFRMARRGATGYEVGDVDTFIDKVEESFAQFENERDLLRREVEAARTTGDSAPAGNDEALAAKDHEITSLRTEVERLRNQVAQQAKQQQAPVASPGQLDDKRVAQLTQDTSACVASSTAHVVNLTRLAAALVSATCPATRRPSR